MLIWVCVSPGPGSEAAVSRKEGVAGRDKLRLRGRSSRAVGPVRSWIHVSLQEVIELRPEDKTMGQNLIQSQDPVPTELKLLMKVNTELTVFTGGWINWVWGPNWAWMS